MLVGFFESFTGVGFKALEDCIFNLWKTLEDAALEDCISSDAFSEPEESLVSQFWETRFPRLSSGNWVSQFSSFQIIS